MIKSFLVANSCWIVIWGDHWSLQNYAAWNLWWPVIWPLLGLQALSDMAWAQLPLFQTEMIGFFKSAIFDRKRIFCHGPFAIATVVYPTVRADEATSQVDYTPHTIKIAPSWELPQRKFIFHPQVFQVLYYFLGGCNQNLPFLPASMLHFRWDPPWNPPHPSLTLHLVQGENHATLGSGLHGVYGDHLLRLTSPPKMHTCPLKNGPLYTGKVVFQSSFFRRKLGELWFQGERLTPTNHHECKTQQKYAWLNTHIYQRQIGAEKIRHVHVPPVFANIRLSISVLSWDLLGMIDVEKQKLHVASTSNMTSGASGAVNMAYTPWNVTWLAGKTTIWRCIVYPIKTCDFPMWC